MNTTSQSEQHRRSRRSRAEVAELVAGFERSGLGRTEYCLRHGLSLTTLKRYSKRMSAAGSGRRARAESIGPTVSLIPVEVMEPSVAQQAMQPSLFVELCGGRRIGVGTGFDAATLKRLVVALSEV